MTLLEQYIKLIAENEENKTADVIDAFEYFAYKFTLSFCTYTINHETRYKIGLPFEVIEHADGDGIALNYVAKEKRTNNIFGSTEALYYYFEKDTVIISKRLVRSISQCIELYGVDSDIFYNVDFDIFKRFIKIAKRYDEFIILCKKYSK